MYKKEGLKNVVKLFLKEHSLTISNIFINYFKDVETFYSFQHHVFTDSKEAGPFWPWSTQQASVALKICNRNKYIVP